MNNRKHSVAQEKTPRQPLSAVIDERIRHHERAAQTSRTKTERCFEAAYHNSLWELREDLREAGLL